MKRLRGFVAGVVVAPLLVVGGMPSVAEAATFRDVPGPSQFFTEIEWMAAYNISTGYGDRTFRPLQSVNRDAMAAFMYRLAGKPAFTPPKVSPFRDVTPRTQFYKEITWLASKGISTGWPDKTFRPVQPVARDAMAAFMYRYRWGKAMPFYPAAPNANTKQPNVGRMLAGYRFAEERKPCDPDADLCDRWKHGLDAMLPSKDWWSLTFDQRQASRGVTWIGETDEVWGGSAMVAMTNRNQARKLMTEIRAAAKARRLNPKEKLTVTTVRGPWDESIVIRWEKKAYAIPNACVGTTQVIVRRGRSIAAFETGSAYDCPVSNLKDYPTPTREVTHMLNHLPRD